MKESNENFMMAMLCLITTKVLQFSNTFHDNLMSMLFTIGFVVFMIRAVYVDFKKK